VPQEARADPIGLSAGSVRGGRSVIRTIEELDASFARARAAAE